MAIREFSKVVALAVLGLGMGVASWGYAAPRPMPEAPQSGAYLGVMVEQLSAETAAALHLAGGGTLIVNVDQDGPACLAGLRSGDIVTAFNGKPVSGPDQFAGMIHSSGPGGTVTLTVLRNGRSQDMKVKLGDWKQMAAMPPPPPRPPLSPAGTNPMPPMPAPDVPGYSPLLARSGILVEPLTPQLCDFFGVPQNEGVLVRSVDHGSPGAAAGLRAGDVIVRVNNDTIHDMADWKRALKAQGGKLSLSIVRDKRAQTLQMVVPANTSEWKGGDWDGFDQKMQALAAEMEKLKPEFEKNAQEMAKLSQLDRTQWDEINRQAKAAAATITPEMKKQAEQMRKDMEKMTPEMTQAARDMAESMKPTAKEWADMEREMSETIKALGPELQKQMDEFQKQWQQEMRQWQESFKGSNPKQL